MAKKIEIGDEVKYVPHIHHALEQDGSRNFAWVLGLKKLRSTVGASGRHEYEEQVEEMDSKTCKEFFELLGRHPNPQEERKRLVLLRPYKPWRAVVRGINPDGTYNLDIDAAKGGVTLNYDSIPYDASKKKPHTFHV